MPDHHEEGVHAEARAWRAVSLLSRVRRSSVQRGGLVRALRPLAL